MKTKERTVTELSTELASKVGQLDYANKELESLRCRIIRVGAETERWQTDLNSVQTSNRFLSTEADELRLKLSAAEENVMRLQHEVSTLKKSFKG